ncbi:MAG: hypothetical protein ACREDM_13105 [Methylocella sp.]
MALCVGPAFALQNVANTSQKGSLLIFPKITVDPEDFANTLIEVSNDEISPVHIVCYYVNERKDRVDFDFTLTPKATVSWEVLTGSGDIAAPLFPSAGKFPGNAARGELICFAVDAGALNQIAFNNLIGTATVVNLADKDARQPRQGYRYNAWAFVARNAAGLPEADNVIQGTPGKIQLTGLGAGTYDACPAYNIANFVPNFAIAGGVGTIDNDLSGVSCNQDLRQDFVLHLTKLQFTVWNVNEVSFTGSYACVDSVFTVPFGAGETTVTPVTNRSNFDFSTLRTDNARFQVKGVPSTQCPGPPPSEHAGLLGVLTSSVELFSPLVDAKAKGTVEPSFAEDFELGSTTQGAGAHPGFVWWDPGSVVLPGRHHR